MEKLAESLAREFPETKVRMRHRIGRLVGGRGLGRDRRRLAPPRRGLRRLPRGHRPPQDDRADLEEGVSSRRLVGLGGHEPTEVESSPKWRLDHAQDPHVPRSLRPRRSSSAPACHSARSPRRPVVGTAFTNAQTLCLNDDRFEVSARFRTASSGETDATGVDADRRLRLLLVFRSREHRGRHQGPARLLAQQPAYWVFATGLTNVEVTLLVSDTETDTVETYINQLGVPFAPIQDTSAFATCP